MVVVVRDGAARGELMLEGMMDGEGAEVKFVADLQPALCLFG